MKKYYVLRFWCKKQKLVHFGLVLVQTVCLILTHILYTSHQQTLTHQCTGAANMLD